MPQLPRPCILVLALASCTGGNPSPIADPRAALLYERSLRLLPLHEAQLPVESGDWLAEHEESGQTFTDYLGEGARLATGDRRKIYVVPIGDFDESRQRVLDQTVSALRLWFGLDVEVEPGVPLASIPQSARRTFEHGGWQQLYAGYLMNRVLRPELPSDAACRIGFVSADLWPGAGWNFVFGQASLRERIGVWSLYRNGDPSHSPAAFRLCLLRTLKTATHEIGHMFGIRHCTAWSCNMAGSNHQQEADQHPWRLCPECLPKLLWATGHDGVPRYEQLARFAADHELQAEGQWFLRAANAWREAARKQ